MSETPEIEIPDHDVDETAEASDEHEKQDFDDELNSTYEDTLEKDDTTSFEYQEESSNVSQEADKVESRENTSEYVDRIVTDFEDQLDESNVKEETNPEEKSPEEMKEEDDKSTFTHHNFVDDQDQVNAKTSDQSEPTEWTTQLEAFNGEKWDSMDGQDRQEAIYTLRDSVAEDLKIDNKPDVEFYSENDPTDFGGYSASENKIYINDLNMNDARETADTIAHESRHCYQHEHAQNPQNETDLAYKENFEHYIRPEVDYEGYKNQLVESDARAYASHVVDHVPEQVSFKMENESVSKEGVIYHMDAFDK